MIDSLPVLPALILAFLAGVTWLVLEFRHATPDPDNALTRLDVYERTGVYPHGGV